MSNYVHWFNNLSAYADLNAILLTLDFCVHGEPKPLHPSILSVNHISSKVDLVVEPRFLLSKHEKFKRIQQWVYIHKK